MHGVIMVFFFLIPSIPAVLGNFLIPPMIGAKDLAFPRINLLSLYIYWIGGIFTLYAMIARRRRYRLDLLHAVQHGGSNTNVVPTALGIFIAGFSSILTGLNFIVTIHRMRAPGHDVVPPAAVRVGALRHQPGAGARHAGASRSPS